MESVLKTNSKIEFKRATGTIGAWVSGVELGVEGDAEQAASLQRALAEHGVLFFDFGRVPTGEQFIQLGRNFGEVETGYGQKVTDKPTEDDVPHIDSARVPMKDYYQNWWHQDGAPLDNPPLAALLTPLELPEAGGGTMFSSMTAAWDALSPRFQQMLDGLEAVHNNARPSFLEPKEHVWPVVLTNPITGRKSLYVNSIYTQRLIGLSDKESDSVLRFLFDHVNTPEFHVRIDWKLGYVGVWHQQVTQHRGVADFTGPRKLKRLTIAGGPLTGAVA